MVEALEGDVAAVGDQSAHRLAAARREAAAVGAVQVEAGQRDAPGGGRSAGNCVAASHVAAEAVRFVLRGSGLTAEQVRT